LEWSLFASHSLHESSLLENRQEMNDMSHLSGNAPVHIKQLRERLAKMSDAELLRFGKAAPSRKTHSASNCRTGFPVTFSM
jgi:hypothetical protein